MKLQQARELLAEIQAERERWERTQIAELETENKHIYYLASGTVSGLRMAEDIIIAAMKQKGRAG